MRILHVIAGAKTGPRRAIAVDAAIALAEAGLTQHVVCRPQQADWIATLHAADTPTTTAPFDKVWRSPTRQALAQTVEAFNPDVIHFWMSRAASFARRRWRDRSLGWHGGAGKLSRFRHCRWHACLNAAIAKRLTAAGVAEDRVAVLSGYAPFEPIAPMPRAQMRTSETAPVALAIADTPSLQGLDTVFAAQRAVPALTVWIAASGPTQAYLIARARLNGVEGRVRFAPADAPREALLAACDLVILAGRGEGRGAEALQAWAARRPIVALLGDEAAALIEPGQTGILPAQDEPGALAGAIQMLLDDATLALHLADQGERAFRAGYTKPAFVRSTMALYEKISRSADNRQSAPQP